LKPSGDIALIDFGSVREIQPDQARQENSRHRNPTIVSSAGYSPPEQFNGQAMFTSDFYALGRTWVQLLTGQMPLDLIELTTNRLRWHHLTQISKPFAKWLDTLMSISPERRPASTEIIHEDLTTRLPRQIRRSRVVNSWAFKGIVTAAAIAALIGISAKYTDWKANEHLQQGTKNLQAGYYPLARTEFEAAVQANDRSSVAHNNLGLACYYLADDACAVQHYERAISLDATNWEAHNNLAALYDRQGRYDLAASQYLIAANGPNDLKAQAISNLARLKNLQGQYKEAESLVHSVLGLTQVRVSLAALYKNLGWALFGVKHYSEAQAALEQARAFDGSRVDTYCLLALVRSAQKLDANNEAKACLFSVSSLPLPEVQEWRNQIEKARI
jgi:tetratricopeptide (TPR) repeat protein